MARLGRSFPFQPNLGGESPVLREPSGLSPLAKSTTPGQLTVRTTLVAVRTQVEQTRRAPHSKLRPPTVVLTRAARASVLSTLVAVRPQPARASHWKLFPPVVAAAAAAAFVAPPVATTLVAVRRRVERQRREFPESQLFPPLYLSPLARVTTPGQLRILATLAAHHRLSRAPQSRLSQPTVVRVPSVEQREQTISVRLARIRPPKTTSSLGGPLYLSPLARVTTPGQLTTRISRVRIRPPHTTSNIGEPTVVRVPSVEQREDTVGVTLAGRTRAELARRAPHSTLGQPLYLSPLARVTTPGQLAIRRTLARIRPPHVTQILGKPTVLRVPSVEQQEQTIRAVFAPHSRLARASHFSLRPPTVVRVPSVEQAEDTIRVSLARIRPRPTTTRLAPPTVVRVPSVEQREDTITVALAPHPRQARAPRSSIGKPTVLRVPSVEQAEDTIRVALAPSPRQPRAPHSRLAPPAALQVFLGPATPLVRIRPPKTTSSIGEPTVVRVPSIEQREDTITVALASVDTRTGQPPRAPHSFLAEPLYLSPLAVVTTPGQLRVAAVFAGRTRREIQRLRSIWQLSPPEVVRVPSVEQREDTVGVVLAPHSRLARAPHSNLAPPTTLHVFAGPNVSLAPNPRQARAPHSSLGAPQAVRVPSVELRLRTISVTLAGRTRLEWKRHQVESVLGPARYLSPLAKPTTPGQLTVRKTLVQIRTRTEQSRHGSHWKLSVPTKVIPLPTLREQQTVKVALAGRTRAEISRHASHWKLAPPTKIVPLLTLRQQTVSVWLAGRTATEATRHAQHSTLRPPTRVVPLPSLEQQTVAVALVRIRPPMTNAALREPVVLARAEDTILVTLAAHSRLARATHSRLALPTALLTFAGPETQLARIRPSKTTSTLGKPTLVRVPSVEQAEDTIRVSLAPSPRQARAPHSRLAPPTVLRVPSVEQAEDTIRVALATAPRQPRTPRSRLAPPTVVRPAVDTIRVALAPAPRNARQAHSRLAPPTVVTRPAPRTERVAVALVDVADRVPRRKARSRLAAPTVILIPVPPVAPTGGIGGSGMSDEEYERLLRRLGALPKELSLSDLDLEEAVYVLRMLGFME